MPITARALRRLARCKLTAPQGYPAYCANASMQYRRLNVEIRHRERVLLNKLPARLNVIAH